MTAPDATIRTRAKPGRTLPRPAPIPVYHSADYGCAAEDFDTTRKAGWIREADRRAPIPGIEWRTPAPATAAQLARVHLPRYVEAVRTGVPADLARSQGFAWDPGLWRSACAMAGGFLAAMDAALQDGAAGTLSSGQHHARADQGMGFCTFNGLVLAAHRALEQGARSVLIVDLDAHCAGGTHSMIGDDERIGQLDVALNCFDVYTPGSGESLDVVRRARDYLPVITRRLAELDARGARFDACVYYAGMDPHEHSVLGGLRGIDAGVLRAREQLLFGWCRERALPVAFGIGGGYTSPRFTQAQLVALHRLTLEACVQSRRGAPHGAGVLAGAGREREARSASAGAAHPGSVPR